MKKLLRVGLILLTLVLLLSSAALAMGPLMVTAHSLAWDRNTDSATGYYIYWRVPPSTTWVNTQRSPQILQPAVGVIPVFNVLTLNLPNGNYEWCATAYNEAGDESGPSNIVPLALAIPVSPANLKKQ